MRNTTWMDIEDGNLVIYTDYADKGVPKKVGASWDRIHKRWQLPFTILNVESIKRLLPTIFATDKLKESVEEQKNRENELEEIKELSKSSKDFKYKVPGITKKLFTYQKYGVQFLAKCGGRALLGDEMGTGKSVMSISFAMQMKHNENIPYCFVMTPASLKWNWAMEIEFFTNERYVIIDGTPDKRLDQWQGKVYCKRNNRGDFVYYPVKNEEDKPFFYVVNFELVVQDLFAARSVRISDEDTQEDIQKKRARANKQSHRASLLSSWVRQEHPCVIVDEIHSLKTHSAKRTRCIKQLKAKYRIGLSGTPLDGRLEELHSVMQFLVPGLFPPKTAFMARHAEYDFWGKVKSYKHVNEINKKIQPFFIRRLKKDVSKDLPDKIYEDKIVVLSKEEMKVYKELAKRGHAITEDSQAMTAILRCRQFCDHPSLLDLDIKSSKFQMFKDVLDEVVVLNGNKVIVFSQYRTMTDIITEEMDKLGLRYLYINGDTPSTERAKMQEMFNNNHDIDMMIGTEAMSTGLNFTGASVVIHYDDNWSPSLMGQRTDRAHRHGQKNNVTVINFVCKDTVEERVRYSLQGKMEVSAEVLGDGVDEIALKKLDLRAIAKML